MSIIFLAGTYGVGKSTLAAELSRETGISCFSAGDLISEVNGEEYGANKLVKDKDANQKILALRVSELLKTQKSILLAGHFCILNREGKVTELPLQTFQQLHLSKIILLEAPREIVQRNLNKRDGVSYEADLVDKLQVTEREQAENAATLLGCPLIVHTMHYDSRDVAELREMI